MITVTCQHCGAEVVVDLHLGRKSKGLPVKNVCDAIRAYQSVTAAAESLGVSRALLYQRLKSAGMSAAEVLQGVRA